MSDGLIGLLVSQFELDKNLTKIFPQLTPTFLASHFGSRYRFRRNAKSVLPER
jgi:hypothetical protein